MKKWLPLTYGPKIQRVIDGIIRTTIRPGKYTVDDSVAFHGWEGTPYRSKWSFRTPFFRLVEITSIRIFRNGFTAQSGILHGWADPLANIIALRDGIIPDRDGATAGETLGRLLNTMYCIPPEGKQIQILRW